MTKLFCAAVAILLSSSLMTTSISACGDKISNSARGIWRYSKPLGKQQAILIWVSDEVLKALPRKSEWMADLRNEGFKPTTVYRPEDIAANLKGEWDLVVVGSSDVDTVSAALGPEKVLLIAQGASDQEKKAAKKKYPWVVTKIVPEDFVLDVADALEAAAKAAKKKTRS